MELKVTDTNYCATVVKIDRLFPLENCDNLLWFSVFGFTAIVSKDTKEWDVWVVFTAETRLSDEYLKNNNMYREPTLNKDNSQKWYIEANRRVRAMKLRGNISSALFMPLESLNYVCDSSKLNIWDTFNEIDWISICEKYFIEKLNGKENKTKWSTKVFKRIDNIVFPEHIDSENYFRNKQYYNDDDDVIVTQKLHGSSLRMWYVRCKRNIKRYEKLLSKLWITINHEEYDYVWTSRRVIKNWEDSWYYTNDIWKQWLDKYKSSLPKDWIFYWEVIGWDWEKPIQKNYTYNLPKWELDVYIYRISIVNPDWISMEMPLEEVIDWCNNHWMKSVPLLWRWKHKDFIAEEWLNKTYYPIHNVVPLCEQSPCDEWCVVRRNNPLYVTKCKSPDFLQMETKMLDEWVLDIESWESICEDQ